MGGVGAAGPLRHDRAERGPAAALGGSGLAAGRLQRRGQRLRFPAGGPGLAAPQQ